MKKLFRAAIVAVAMCLPAATMAKITHLLPKPQQIEAKSGAAFALGRTVTITDPTNSTALQKFFTDNGCTIATGGAQVTVTLVGSIEGAYDYTLAGYENEAYTLDITANAINITAVTKTGVIRAAQTLTQLAEGYDGTPALEALTMTDWPAFKLRGYMHDVGRSFIEFETLKKHIDLLARFKVNTFHWHMTENQAWRFEVKSYPQLTSSASMTRFAGKYYTQEQCRELQDYAKERGVIVIPEIDMPGHSQAFKTAMGHSMQTDQGVAELKVILEEVAAVFPDAPYIHIGADEETIEYPNFLKIMTDKVHSLGKKVVVWNPIRGVTISTSTGADMTQMWSSSGKVINGMPNIDCRYNYTNHFDVFADLVGIYKSNIYYEQKGNANVAGTISAPWNDRKTPTEEDIIAQNNFYANVIASAERAWIGGGKQYIEKGGTTLPNSGEEYEEFADWERRFLFHKANSLKNEPIPYVKQTNVRWRITDPFPNGGDMNASFAPETEGLKESYTVNGTTYGTGIATGAGIYLRHTWGNNTVPTYYGSTNHSNSTAYAWTYVYSDKAQTVGAQIEFQNYGRSEKDTAPDAGKWDRKGSRIWLNDTEILPPTWDNTGVGINNEVDLKNENFTARKPLQVTLKQGWNKVFIKLPYVGASGVRLNKWMFTFVLTDLEGKNAVEGLIYSPNQRMDVAAEQLEATITEIKKEVAASTGEQPGQYSPALANDLNTVIAEIESTLGITMSEEERAAQLATLNAAFAAFKAALATAKVNQPKTSDNEVGYYYTMCTPQRDNRYAASNGANAEMTGNATVNDAAKWKFVARNDGKYNIVNKNDGTYISPASSNNTALRTQANEPASGWELKEAATQGLFIIVSGDVQFNQTNSSLGYKVYNWGSGTNTTDTGCQYLVTEVETVEGEGGEVTPPTEETKTVGIIASKGRYTASNSNGTWHSRWESNEVAGFSFAASANNMKTVNDCIAGYSGTSQSSTYTITAPEGWMVTDLQFDYVNTDAGTHTLRLSIDGKTYTSSSTKQSLKVAVSDPQRTFSFVQSGENKGITFSNFIVTIEKDTRVPEVSQEIFTTATSGDIPYRIPAIAMAKNGDLIAVADYRHSRADIGMASYGRIDLHARISKDNGANWNAKFPIVEGKGSSSPDFMHVGFGDPCIVADRESNRVLVLSCAGNVSFPNGTRNNHQNIARFYSEDNGATWSEPVDIADAIYAMWDQSSNHGPVRAMFIGSGKIHQSRYVKVNNYYRLYCAVLLKNVNSVNTNFVLYSDDFGGSWKVLGGVENAPVPNGGDEPKVEELPNGNIVISSRINGGRYYNIYTFTDKEAATGSWGSMATSNSANGGVVAQGNSCNGEIMMVPVVRTEDNKEMWLALQSLPFGNGRANVGIYYKALETENDYNTPANFARDWDGRHQASYLASAYSTMCFQKDSTIAFLYEEDTYGINAYGGYNIMYKNYSIEQITNGKYTVLKGKEPGVEPEQPEQPGQPDEDRTLYRIKSVSQNKYLHIEAVNMNYSTGPKGSVGLAGYAEDNSQIFALEDAGNNKYYIVSVNGYYIVCRQWNIDASNQGSKSPLGLEYKNDTEFYIQNGSQYFKVGPVDGDANSYYPYCDASLSAAELWVLEEVGNATGVEEVKSENGEVKGIYDLSGRKLSEITAPGIYIIGGKKVFVK